MEGQLVISGDADAVSILAHLPNPVFVIDDRDRSEGTVANRSHFRELCRH